MSLEPVRRPPRAPSVPPEHQDIVDRIELEHRVSTLESSQRQREVTVHRRLAVLQWAVGIAVSVIIVTGGGMIKYAYDAHLLLTNRVIAVEKHTTDRIDNAVREATMASLQLTTQVARLDERLAAVQSRLAELQPGSSGAGAARRAGRR